MKEVPLDVDNMGNIFGNPRVSKFFIFKKEDFYVYFLKYKKLENYFTFYQNNTRAVNMLKIITLLNQYNKHCLTYFPSKKCTT